MASKIEELQQRREQVQEQIAIGSQFGTAGVLRVELEAVKAKLSAVSVDTPTEDLMEALQREAALTLKIATGEAELKRIDGEIAQIKYFENQSIQRAQAQRHQEQERIRKGQERISEIDGVLAGTKPFPPTPPNVLAEASREGPRGGGFLQTYKANQLLKFKAERDKLVSEFGTPEQYKTLREREELADIEAMLAGKKRMPELSYEIQMNANRYDMNGHDGYLQRERKNQREELERERAKLLASLDGEETASQAAGSATP
jgi:hypothetical protein